MGTYANDYPAGQCTHGAASMKGNIPDWGNAADWAANARAAGYTVSDVPVVGAVAQHGGGLGHVGVVVGVRPGEILFAEMNYDWNGGVRTTWVSASLYQYIYI
jgi:surface antigen